MYSVLLDLKINNKSWINNTVTGIKSKIVSLPSKGKQMIVTSRMIEGNPLWISRQVFKNLSKLSWF